MYTASLPADWNCQSRSLLPSTSVPYSCTLVPSRLDEARSPSSTRLLSTLVIEKESPPATGLMTHCRLDGLRPSLGRRTTLLTLRLLCSFSASSARPPAAHTMLTFV